MMIKKKGMIKGYYAGHDRTNNRVQERLRAYMENKVRPRNEKKCSGLLIYMPKYQLVK